MPALAAFAKENVNFTQHMELGRTADSGLFGLFYGDFAWLYGRCPSRRVFSAALITALNQQGYQLGLFSSMGLTQPAVSPGAALRFLAAEREDPERRADGQSVDRLARPLRAG
ncbi:hypothetical protein LNO89_25815 [Klebsiella pneumoniae subsp. pneumoniae]|nr:hypothetical protein [Klebsiella pneumoniae subsp. pneumoniae]